MLTILKGFTGLWSARATKLVVIALCIGGLYWYVTSLKEQIELQQVDIDAKEQQLLDKRAEIVSLKVSIEQANDATQMALMEIEAREDLAAQRLTMITTLRDQLSEFKNNLNELERVNEQVKHWANEPVPVAIVGLLNNARGTAQNGTSIEGSESTATSTADSRLLVAYGRRPHERRLSYSNRHALPIIEYLQF